MHERTKELRRLIDKHGLTSKEVAALTSVKEGTVNCWRSTIKVIPDTRLSLLKLKLESR